MKIVLSQRAQKRINRVPTPKTKIKPAIKASRSIDVRHLLHQHIRSVQAQSHRLFRTHLEFTEFQQKRRKFLPTFAMFINFDDALLRRAPVALVWGTPLANLAIDANSIIVARQLAMQNRGNLPLPRHPVTGKVLLKLPLPQAQKSLPLLSFGQLLPQGRDRINKQRLISPCFIAIFQHRNQTLRARSHFLSQAKGSFSRNLPANPQPFILTLAVQITHPMNQGFQIGLSRVMSAREKPMRETCTRVMLEKGSAGRLRREPVSC